LPKLVAQIVARFDTDPAQIMSNCPNQHRVQAIETFNPISSDTIQVCQDMRRAKHRRNRTDDARLSEYRGSPLQKWSAVDEVLRKMRALDISRSEGVV
jgi:hypothetical protein